MTTTSSTISATSLSGLGLTGLSSGLDTSGIITKLMAIEAQPQTLLKNQLTDLQTHTSALQSLNTAVAGIATTAKAAVGANALASFTATSDATGVTATASSTASPGSISFRVDQLATAQVSVSKPLTSFDASQLGTITVRTGVAGSYKDTPVTLKSGDLDSVVSAINSSGAGVTATKVAAGSLNGVAQYRLQLRSSTGDAGAFSVSLGSTYTSDASATLGLTQISTAHDAQITLYPGTGADTPVKSATNRFSSVLPGLDLTASAASASTVTVTVAADATAASTSAQALTSGLIAVFAGIASGSAVTTSSSSSGSSSATTGGVFTGDTLVRTLKDALLSAATDPDKATGKSPSTIGINLTKDGTITFDQAKFASAMAADPVATTAMYQAIAQRVSDVASRASAPSTGTISSAITSATNQQSDMTSKVSDWDTRLATIQAQYELQFNNLEVALNSLTSQANYLTSQITGLTTNYQSS